MISTNGCTYVDSNAGVDDSYGDAGHGDNQCHNLDGQAVRPKVVDAGYKYGYQGTQRSNITVS